MMTRRDWIWLAVALVVNYTISVALLLLVSFQAFLIWSFLGAVKGYLLGRWVRARRRRQAREQWRSTHPNLGEVWMPEHLREKT